MKLEEKGVKLHLTIGKKNSSLWHTYITSMHNCACVNKTYAYYYLLDENWKKFEKGQLYRIYIAQLTPEKEEAKKKRK